MIEMIEWREGFWHKEYLKIEGETKGRRKKKKKKKLRENHKRGYDPKSFDFQTSFGVFFLLFSTSFFFFFFCLARRRAG